MSTGKNAGENIIFMKNNVAFHFSFLYNFRKICFFYDFFSLSQEQQEYIKKYRYDGLRVK